MLGMIAFRIVPIGISIEVFAGMTTPKDDACAASLLEHCQSQMGTAMLYCWPWLRASWIDSRLLSSMQAAEMKGASNNIRALICMVDTCRKTSGLELPRDP